MPPATPVFEAPASWRAIDFISDLHLSADAPRVFDAWAAHLRATAADAVFILGDLFETWVGDDVAAASFEAGCAQVLLEASQRRAIAFMPGNRDFLVGDAMLRAVGVTRLADPTVIAAFGTRTLLSHGDALCLDDEGYQRFRRVVRRPWLQRAFLALPRSGREATGRLLRSKSGGRPAPSRVYADLDPAATAAWMADAGTPVLVHGHTHAPATHGVVGAGVRHVLSDWHIDAHSSRAEVLRWTTDGFARIAPEGVSASR